MTAPTTIAVAWIDRTTYAKVWCRASQKRTTNYVDNVKTRCGFWVTGPCGLEPPSHEITCPMCLAREPQRP